MRLPVYIDGAADAAGSLTLEERGGHVVLDARLRDVGRVVRLTLYGDGKFYLGVPVPEDGGLRLVRRLSAAEAAGLPRRPAYAAEHPRREGPEGQMPRHVLWLGGRPHYF